MGLPRPPLSPLARWPRRARAHNHKKLSSQRQKRCFLSWKFHIHHHNTRINLNCEEENRGELSSSSVIASQSVDPPPQEASRRCDHRAPLAALPFGTARLRGLLGTSRTGERERERRVWERRRRTSDPKRMLLLSSWPLEPAHRLSLEEKMTGAGGGGGGRTGCARATSIGQSFVPS